MQVGPPIRTETGSIPVPIDYTNQCTSVIELVLSTIITSLKLDGTMDFIYQRKLANYWDKSCKIQPAFVPVEPLDYNQTAGVFLGYCAFICVTIVIGFLTIAVGYWHETAARKQVLQRIGNIYLVPCTLPYTMECVLSTYRWSHPVMK